MDAAPPAQFTPAQARAIDARGNVLVMAGAGAGKTKTLVERCLHCLEHHSAALDELLIVTFTEAAAAEMRDRLRRAIDARARLAVDPLRPVRPDSNWWAGQLARFDLAHIGTLHSFCLKLVREHFYELGLDPRLALLDEGQARQLANETLDDQFAAHYAGADPFSAAVQDLIQVHGNGNDEPIRKLVLQLHHYSQARPDASGWLAQQRQKFSAPRSPDWEAWLRSALAAWRAEWLPALEALAPANEKARELSALLAPWSDSPVADAAAADLPLFSRPWRNAATDVLAAVLAAAERWPKGRKTLLRKPLERFFEEAQFLHSLTAASGGVDPLAEDWSWVHAQMETLLRLAEEFARQLTERKHANGVLDFHDLEQYALRLLWNPGDGQPSPVAETWRARLKFVFVDEYQDINAAQDRIIQGLSRETNAANRFLVGDVKQSIYRFRLADPSIFRNYGRQWRGSAGQTIALSENFRSREGLLRLVNSVFHLLMREEVGGVSYDAEAELKFGAPEARAQFSVAKTPFPATKLLLRLKAGRPEPHDDDPPLANLDDTQREARLVAASLQELVATQAEIFDDVEKQFRPVKWRDIAILLRSPRGRSEVYAKEFERAGIPLAVARTGFYESAEILDLLSLLQLLDNPLQDLPCIAVLRSPLVGLSLDDLAEIRLAAPNAHFWTALNRSVATSILPSQTAGRLQDFLAQFSRWRHLAKLVSLSQCLDDILANTLYLDWLRAQPRGSQRTANVAAFLRLARQFDEFQRQGLFRFLKFIDAQQEVDVEPEVPAVATGDTVRLMSIHQSKGLEFPVVVLADLAKQFNEQDLRGDIIFDEEYGPAPKVKPPHVGRRYPSLPHWLARRRQKRELRGEELRLLYVALTRARDRLILSASLTKKEWEEKWTVASPVIVPKIAAAKSFADWLALWFSTHCPHLADERQGSLDFFHWQIVEDAEVAFLPLASGSRNPNASVSSNAPECPPSRPGAGQGERNDSVPNPGSSTPASHPAVAVDAIKLDELQSRLAWHYPFLAATRRKAKSSVTALRREAGELDPEAERVFPDAAREPRLRLQPVPASSLTAAEIGAAHHKFLERVALDHPGALLAEADRLLQENYLTAEERAVLDLKALSQFWDSPVGRKVRARAAEVRRELPFTARFSAPELSAIVGSELAPGLEHEFVVVQGVADLVVLLPREIWLLDFKTDEVSARDLAEKVKIYTPQLRLYALALERIFSRPVTFRALYFLAAGRTEEIE